MTNGTTEYKPDVIFGPGRGGYPIRSNVKSARCSMDLNGKLEMEMSRILGAIESTFVQIL